MRRTRTLGLGVVMALALFAFPAGASASGGIEAEVYPVTLQGEGTAHSLVIEANEYSCASWFQTSLAQPIDKIAVSPNWNSCLPQPINANGCKFIFHPGTENSVDIGPLGCGPITTTLASCTVSIGAQAGFPASYQNVGEGSKERMRVKVSLLLDYVKSGTFCSKKGTFKGAQYQGEWEVIGLDQSGGQIGVHTTDEGDLGAGGFFIAGEESKVEAEQPRFEAKNYPATISGELEPKSTLKLKFAGMEIVANCETAQFNAKMSSAGSTLATETTYGECFVEGLGTPATISMSSCQNTFGIANAGPPFIGDLVVNCVGKGDVVKIDWSLGIFGKCAMTVPPQSLGDVSYENLGEGSDRAIVAGIEASGIEYSWVQTGIGCGNKKVNSSGSGTDGTLTGDVELSAFQ